LLRRTAECYQRKRRQPRLFYIDAKLANNATNYHFADAPFKMKYLIGFQSRDAMNALNII